MVPGLIMFLLTLTVTPSIQQALPVYVIAPSVSTSVEARALLVKNPTWRRSSLRDARAVLVVVRSGLSNPLRIGYESLCELRDHADRQLNIAGPEFHVYVYALDDDLIPAQRDHVKYPADR
jgi:hypothetical protein